MAKPSDLPVALWLENLKGEQDGVALYEGLAAIEADPARAEQFAQMARAEGRHAAIWRKKLERAGSPLPAGGASPRVRLLLWLARRFGTRAVLPLVMMAESADADKYTRQGDETATLVAEERAHGDTLRQMRGAPPLPARGRITERERWHRLARGGALRAGVFGMNDGLVSNLALVLGVAAAGAPHATVLVAGVAGLLAGALSMAAGEYVSVASQRDLLARQVELERRELVDAPEEEEDELRELLAAKGLPPEQAAETARQIMKDPESALDTLVREELGLDPSDLGSPRRAAVASFATFATGAALPLAPFLFLAEARTAAAVAVGVCGLVLATVGGLLGFVSGTNPLRSAARMVGLAALAAGVTVAVGRLLGITLG